MRWILSLAAAVALIATGTSVQAQTTFTFGGYVKMDAMTSNFHNGPVPLDNALRDFHFPGAIPVGSESDVFATNDYHAKESRFNLETRTTVGEKALRAFVEMDFLLAGQDDERVSNSFNPRLRHFFFVYDEWTFGQTWTTFQILASPEPRRGSFSIASPRSDSVPGDGSLRSKTPPRL